MAILFEVENESLGSGEKMEVEETYRSFKL